MRMTRSSLHLVAALLSVCLSASAQTPEAAALDREIQARFEAKDYAAAIPLLEKLLAIREERLGADDAETIKTVGALAYFLREAGRRAQATRYGERQVAWHRQRQPTAVQTSRYLNNLALDYAEIRDFARGEAIYREALTILARAEGADEDVARTAGNYAMLLCSAERHADAIEHRRKAATLLEKLYGPADAKTIAGLRSLSNELAHAGATEEARAVQKRLAALAPDAMNAEPPEIETLAVEANRLFASGSFKEAVPATDRLIAACERHFGPDHLRTAVQRVNRGVLATMLGDYATARALFERTLPVIRREHGPEHPETLQVMANLALALTETGAFREAEELGRAALRSHEKLGMPTPQMALACSNLATLYHKLGEFARAEPLYEQALGIYEQTIGLRNTNAAAALSNIGQLHGQTRNFDRAKDLLRRAIAIYEQSVGEHPLLASALNNLALVHSDLGEFVPATPLYERALAIHEKAYGPEHPLTITSLAALGVLQIQVGDPEKAAPLLERAHALNEKVRGPKDPATAVSMNNLGTLFARLKQPEKAASFFRPAAEIHSAALGEGHPFTERIYTNLAQSLLDSGRREEAAAAALRARDSNLHVLSNVLAFAPEQQRLAYHAGSSPYLLLAALGLDRELILTMLRHKGVVLDSILEDHALAAAAEGTPEQALLEQLTIVRQQLGQQLLEGRAGENTERLRREAEQIEGQFARHFSERPRARQALGVTIEQVQERLPAETVLIEYLRHPRYAGNGAFIDHYGACVLTDKSEPRWIDLGAADEIEREVALYRKAARGKADERTLTRVLHTLWERLWKPLAGHLSGRRVLISPDADLHFVSFATLLDEEGAFVAGNVSLEYVTTGRDLLRAPAPISAKGVAIFSSPVFEQHSPTLAAQPHGKRSAEDQKLSGLRFAPLPGAEREGAALAKFFSGDAEVATNFTGAAATEAGLRAVRSPRILHLATHGFLLGGGKALPDSRGALDAESRRRFFESPMRRAGLALAGAQATVDLWKRGEALPLHDDGILTAEEVATLDLKQTWLVTLSACDTGSGEAQAGEGVLGLRRGFIQAGVQNLLMTLWPISDETTVDLMLDFYAQALKTGNAPQALAEVQREWLVKLRKEKGLLHAVNRAGAFIMSSQGLEK